MIFEKITPERLDSWSRENNRRAQEILPEIVGRLILSSFNQIKDFNLPYGKGIQFPGYDGYLNVDESTNYVPQGVSVFEFGTNENILNKFDEDIKKRSENPLNITKETTNFIFVSSKIWKHKISIPDKIIETKKNYTWKDIKILDAQIVCLWLDENPAVSIWLSEIINGNISGISTVEKYWDEKTETTKPKLTDKFFINNREEKVNKIKEWLIKSEGYYFIKAESSLEATLFLIAAMKNIDIDIAHKVILIKDRDTWNKVISLENKNIILVPIFPIDDDISCPNYISAILPISKFIPLAKISENFKGMEISRFKHEQFQKNLLELDISHDEISNLEKDTKRCFLPLYRKLSINPLVKCPGWLSLLNKETADLISIMLVSYIDTESQGDLEVLKILTNDSSEFLSKLEEWSKMEDFPIINTGNLYRVVSVQDMWLFLADKIKRNDIENLKKVIGLVFSETTPKYDLPTEERSMAAILGKNDKYSKQLIEGLLISLIFLKERDEMFSNTLIGSTKTAVNVLLKEVLSEIVSEKQWLSIAEFLPLISEACPQVVINKLKKEIRNTESMFWEIFNVEKGNSLFSGNVYHQLLWAIERLLWMEDYAVDAILLLVRIAQKQFTLPNGNTPESSLTQVFNMMFPQTILSKDELAKLLGKIICDYPDVGLKIIDEMSGNNNNHILISISKPEWVDFTDPYEKRSLTYGDWQLFRNKVVDVYFENINETDIRVYEIIFKNIDYFYDGNEQKIQKLIETNIEYFNEEQKFPISINVRKTIFNNKKYIDSESNLPEKTIKFLEDLLPLVEPDNIMKFVYLCKYNPPINNPVPYSDSIKYDMEQEDALVYIERKKATSEIIKVYGLEEMIDYCQFIEDTSDFAKIIVEEVLDGEFDVEFLLKVQKINPNLFSSLLFFLNRDGLETMFKKLESDSSLFWKQKANIFCQTEHSMTLWKEVEKHDSLFQSYFWENSPCISVVRLNKDEVEYYLRKQVEHGRVVEAINSTAYSDYNDYRVLQFLLYSLREYINDENNMNNLDKLDPKNIQNIFEKIYQEKNKDIEKIAILELFFIGVLPFDFYPQSINELISKQPEIYVQLVSNSFLDDSGESKNNSNSISFYKILDRITIIPGCNKYTADKEVFDSWINNVTTIAKEYGYEKAVSLSLGTFLSHSPNGEDGIFPHEIIRDFFEEIAYESYVSEYLIPNFVVGKSNHEGAKVFFGSSSNHEKHMAEKYNNDAKIIKIDYPETSSILKRLSDSYEWSSKAVSSIDERYFD
ncbi:TPA: hypothetical protein ACSJWK_001083 [Listeria monocytogenes]